MAIVYGMELKHKSAAAVLTLYFYCSRKAYKKIFPQFSDNPKVSVDNCPFP